MARKLGILLTLTGGLALLGCADEASGGGAVADAGDVGGDTGSSVDAAPVADATGQEDVAPVDDVQVAADTTQNADTLVAQDTETPVDTSTPVDTTAPPAVGPATWCTSYAEALCALDARCPLPMEPEQTEQACLEAHEAGCWDGAILAAAAATGSVDFDSAKAATCLDELATVTCADVYARLTTESWWPAESCAEVVSGTTGDGDPCALGVECKAGHTCLYGDTCPGTCAALAGPDEACGPDQLCDFEQAVCLAGTCKALPATVGAACESGLCRYPLVCSTETDTCAAPALDGQPCGANGGVCYPGLVCFRANETEVGTCREAGEVGDPCFDQTQCDPLSKDGVLVCQGGVCQVAPGAGEPCFDFRCDDASCDTSALPPTCKALPAAGEPCASGVLCGKGLTCNQGKCAPLGKPGDACTGHAQCESFQCYDGHCGAPGTPPCEP